MKNLSLAQKKMILTAIIIVIVSLLFFLFVYYPARKTVKFISQEIFEVNSQIQDIEAIVAKSKTRQEGIRLLEQKYKEINAKFPREEDETLKNFADLALASNMEIISIRPEAKTHLLDEKKQPVEIEGKACQKVFVSIELEGGYLNLIKYLENLKSNLPVFINIEKLRVLKAGAETKKDSVTLEVSFYLL
jgi:hypothetical protein